MLVKNKDVIYRNPNYKKKVRVLKEVVIGLRIENILGGKAGKIVGKVVREETMQSILDLVSKKDRCLEAKSEMAENSAEEIVKETKKVPFEDVIKEAGSQEELITALGLPAGALKDAIVACMARGRFGMKFLLPTLQKEYGYKSLSQNAIKNLLNGEFAEWCENSNILIEEKSLSYFLKKIVKH